jgi:hypothetical protein
MIPDIEQGYPGWEKELATLQLAYGSEDFTRAILQVYTRDCPAAMVRLLSTIENGDLELARIAIHSLSNIMGVVGPAASRPLIEGISRNLQDGQLEIAAKKAEELESLLRAVLISINTWLAGFPGESTVGGKDSGSKA